MRVVSRGLNGMTDDDPPDGGNPPFNPLSIYQRDEANVEDVTITVGSNTIVARGLSASVMMSCDRYFCNRPFGSYVAGVLVNGVGGAVGPDPQDIPIPGVGTLHLNSEGGPPPRTRALWLEGNPGVPDVVVAEAVGCLSPDGPTGIYASCPAP